MVLNRGVLLAHFYVVNKTEDPSVPYAGQGYIRVLSKIHKRRKDANPLRHPMDP